MWVKLEKMSEKQLPVLERCCKGYVSRGQSDGELIEMIHTLSMKMRDFDQEIYLNVSYNLGREAETI